MPFSFCQKGIAEAVDLSRNRTSKLLRELIEEDLIEVNSSYVKGSKRRRKVYSLTPKGEKKANNIRKKIEEKKVRVKTKSNECETELKNIDSYINSHNPLLKALNNLNENEVIDLTQSEKDTEEIFTGRKDELQFLQNRLEMVKNNGSLTILIKGKAGIGKTRLVNKFKHHALTEGFDFLTGKGHYDTSEPYLPFKEAFKKIQKSDKNRPMKFSYTGAKKDERGVEEEAKTIQNLIFSETTENIRSLAEENPIVIFIDDLQWADKDSLMLFHYLTEKLEDVPVLFISAYRAEDITRDDFLNEVLKRMSKDDLYDELELQPLSWENTKEIAQALIGRIDIPDDFIHIIHETSEGNPLFSKEFLKQMLEDDTVDPNKGKYPSKKDDIELPEVVDDIIGRRIERLDQEHLKVLQTGSIIGEQVPFPLLDFVTGMDTLDLLESIDILTGTGFWNDRSDEDTFHFTHGLIQLSVYESIPGPLRKELHNEVAESIKEVFEDKIEEYYSDIAFHYKLAKEFSKGFEYYRKAGDKAERVYAHEVALEMYKEALELAKKADLNEEKRWDIVEKIGDINKTIGNYDISLEYYEKIPRNKIEPKYKQRIYRKIASVYERKGEFNKAIEAVERGLAEKDGENIENCRLLSRKGFSEMRQGKYDQAERDFLNALDICENFHNGREYADIHHGLGTVYLNTGEFNQSINHLKTALEEWEKIDDLDGKSSSLNSLGNVHLKKGDFHKALENYERSLELRKKIGDKRQISACLNNIATILSKKGEFEKSIEHYRRSHEIWQEIGDQQGIATTYINMGEHYLKKGELDPALENLKKSLEISENIDYIEGVAASLTNLGDIFLRKRELDEARENYQKGLELSRDMEYQQLIPHLLSGLVEIYLQESEFEKALEKGEKALKKSKNIEAKEEEGISHRILGMGYREKKEWDKAKKEFEEGKKILKDVGDKKELAVLLFDYALLWKDMDKDEKKREYLNKALSMFEEMKRGFWIKKCKKEL